MRNFLRNERGSAAAEYVFLMAIIGAGILSGVGYFSAALAGGFNEAAVAIASLSIG